MNAITVGVQSGIGYTDAAPPTVLISEPTYVREENTIELYSGDFGIVTGVGICSNISRANGAAVAIGTAIVFDLYIPKHSPLRDDAINSPNAITRSGLTTGF